MKKLTQDDFIDRCNIIHNFKYDYSRTIYSGNRIKVDVICPIHGPFKQLPKSHIKGIGCPKCGRTGKITTKEFVEKAETIHNYKYDYLNTIYNKNCGPVNIVCKIHGQFTQKANDHLNGHGCPKCGGTGKLTTEIFINRSRQIHNDQYDYSKTIYKNCFEKVIIICRKHGEFCQQAVCHLTGRGCPICKMSGISNLSQKWLDMIGVPKNCREVRIKTNSGKIYIVDGINHTDKIIYEFNGDFWHGNPKSYNPSDMNVISKKTFGELYKETLQKEHDLKEMGFIVKSVWESEFQV